MIIIKKQDYFGFLSNFNSTVLVYSGNIFADEAFKDIYVLPCFLQREIFSYYIESEDKLTQTAGLHLIKKLRHHIFIDYFHGMYIRRP